MYKNKKFGKAAKTKAPLNPIGENTTIKIPRLDNPVDKENESKECRDKELFSQDVLEAIPASQEPTQRYFSQRSTVCRTQLTQSRCTQRPPTTYFELVLIKAGVNLDAPDNFVISCDNVSFVCKFREIFFQCQNYPSNIEAFKTGLQNALNDKKLAMKLLSVFTINMPGEENSYQSQDSMIVNFLMIDFLQKVVINVVLDKVQQFSKKETTTSSDVPLLPLMLSQFRYVTQSHEDLIYTRIVDIFEGAVQSVQWDIIKNAEMILKASKHDAFAEILLNNFASNKDIFHPTTIKTFINLCLSPKMQTKLRCKAVAYIKDGCPPKVLPLLIKLLLKILKDDHDDVIRELIEDLREILMQEFDCTKPDVEQSLKDVFSCIAQGLTLSKTFFDSWQKTIQNLAPANFRSIDFIILLEMMSIKEERSNYIENIIRRRIKLEHITVDILIESKTKYAPILAQLINVFLEILYDFLKEKSKLISDFARHSYSIIFGVGERSQKNILMKLVELTCDKSASSITTVALELIKDLKVKFPSNVQNCGMVLMPFLDRINDMTLPQTRLVMELLCSIAFPAPPLYECTALQDQIDMLIKKQIINRLPIVKKQGIIGAVQMIDNVARIEECHTDCMYDLNESYNTVEELPDGRGKIAANYISRVHSATLHCPESLALFYDELATVCSTGNHQRDDNALLFDRPFVIWLCELITYYFQNSFVIEDQPRQDLGIEISYQKCINSPEDTNTPTESELIPIAVNISQLVLSPSADASSSILVLAPLFNLMRVLHFVRYDGSLEMINALLGCGIILPKVFDNIDSVDIFYEYDDVQSKHILDIFFHTVNWIRETISSFSSQNDPMIRGKVLLRLVDLIRIEECVRKLLIKAPADYFPPVCQFMTMPSTVGQIKKTAGRKKSSGKAGEKKKNLNVSSEPMETEPTMANTTVSNSTRISNPKMTKTYVGKFETTYGPKEMYRQMNPDIMLILKDKFSIVYPRPVEDVPNSIGLLEFKFVVTDIVNKLESITGVQKFTTDQQLQYIVYPNYFITDIVNQFLDPIMNNFHEISTGISTSVQRVDGALGNADLFTDELNYLKICFGLCLRFLAALFSWSGFSDASNKKILKGALLGVLGKSVRQEFINKDVSTLAVEAFNKCRATEASAIDIKSAVHLYHLVQSLKKFATKKDLDQDIRNLCKVLLCRKWFNYDGTMERGTLCNIYLDELVKGYLRKSDFRRQMTILKAILQETQYLKSKENSLRSFPNFNKANFPMLFRGLCETLISTLSSSVRESGRTESDQLRVWEKSCEILNTLLEIIQSLDVPRNFVLFLKHAHFYLKIVLQNGLPVYENYLRENPERVNELLKSLQVTTRFLHNLCCHSKALKNTSILSLIPPLRETVENLVFRVKALLAANKCASVFWMGNLKNKDLHGDEILSQAASWSSANDANSDDDIPDDDASIEETIMGDNDSNAAGMHSVTDASRSTCI